MTLTVLAWDHPRATHPLHACQRAWAAAGEEPFAVATRSLEAFGDDLAGAGAHDVLLVDHPHVGAAALAGLLAPLDELLDASTLGDLAADAVGPSHDCYHHAGHQWAAALDAACQALAVRRGQPPPASWPAVLALARERPGRVALPLHPQHAVSALLSLLAAHGHGADTGVLGPHDVVAAALSTLGELVRCGPDEAFAWEPPEALERLAAGTLDCIPLVYGYVGYDVAWHDAPSLVTGGPPGSILGGVGGAVSAGSPRCAEAARLVAWLASAVVQRELVGPAGGQPASRSAWESRDADPLLPAVRRTIERCRVRPRDPWWPAFQREAGDRLVAGLRRGDEPATLASDLSDLHRRHRERAP